MYWTGSKPVQFLKERYRKLIQITKEEAMAIRENLRGVNVTILNRQSKSKKKRYMTEESPYVMRFLQRLHRNDKVEHYE